MSTIKLFKKRDGDLIELSSSSTSLELNLQRQFEQNLEILLGIRFLSSEFSTTNGGRMDTLGIDENGYPVVIEYKRNRSQNAIIQGLFYLDWIMDHRGTFELLVRKELGEDVAEKIEWSAPRLICVAADFHQYDIHAVKQISRNIDLIRYLSFDKDLLLLELLTSVSTATESKNTHHKKDSKSRADTRPDLINLISDIEIYIKDLGDDVIQKNLKSYVAFRRMRNFVCYIETKSTIKLYLNLNPSQIKLDMNFSRDASNSNAAPGDVEVIIKNSDDFEKAKPLILQSYEAS